MPLFAYVTKRLVKTDVKGWENNIMDHHYSKHMYFFKDDEGVMGENMDREQTAIQTPTETFIQ